MSVTPIPSCDCPMFNPVCFGDLPSGGTIDPAWLSAHYLKYPLAQGAESLLDTTVEGDLTINAGVVDSLGSYGIAGQTLSSTGDNTVEWVSGGNALVGTTVIAVQNVNFFTPIPVSLPDGASYVDIFIAGGGGQSVMPISAQYDEATAKANNAQIQSMSGGGRAGVMAVVNHQPIDSTQEYIAYVYPNLAQWGYTNTSQTNTALVQCLGNFTQSGYNITFTNLTIGTTTLLGAGAILYSADSQFGNVVNCPAGVTTYNPSPSLLIFSQMVILSGTYPNYVVNVSQTMTTSNPFYGYYASNVLTSTGTITASGTTNQITLSGAVPNQNDLIITTNGICNRIVTVVGGGVVETGYQSNLWDGATYFCYTCNNGNSACLTFADSTLIASCGGGGRGTAGNWATQSPGAGGVQGGSYIVNQISSSVVGTGGGSGNNGNYWEALGDLSVFAPQSVTGGISTLGNSYSAFSKGGGCYWSYEGWNVVSQPGSGGIIIQSFRF